MATRSSSGSVFPVVDVPVARIRPEDGLGRKRDRTGHLELQRSIEQFGVLTPITVRRAPDDSGDYLLIKGQGRTLACRMLGRHTIPAMVVDDTFADTAKVQQFLVENVARLKMRPVDRALLIHRARVDGEETASIAKRFGVSPTTVRRLLAQLEGVSSGELAVLRGGNVSLATHAVVTAHVLPAERQTVLDLVAEASIKSKDLSALLTALGWRGLSQLGDMARSQRLVLLSWACNALATAPKGDIRERLGHVAASLPMAFERSGETFTVATR